MVAWTGTGAVEVGDVLRFWKYSECGASRLDRRCKRVRGVEDDSQVLGLSHWKIELLLWNGRGRKCRMEMDSGGGVGAGVRPGVEFGTC